MSQKALICDFDGTLFDAKKWMVYPAEMALEEILDMQVPREELEHRFSTGLRLEDFYRGYAASEDEVQELVACHRDIQIEPAMMATVTPYPRVLETIATLHTADVKLGIATSRGDSTGLLKTLQDHDLFWRFGAVVYLDDTEGDEKENSKPGSILTAVKNAKPDPESLFLAMKMLRVDPKDTFFIGDTKFDLLAGEAAEVTTICALYGYGDDEKLRVIGADHFIKEFSEVVDIVLS